MVANFVGLFLNIALFYFLYLSCALIYASSETKHNVLNYQKYLLLHGIWKVI